MLSRRNLLLSGTSFVIVLIGVVAVSCRSDKPDGRASNEQAKPRRSERSRPEGGNEQKTVGDTQGSNGNNISKTQLRQKSTLDYLQIDFFRGEFNVSGVPLVGETVELTFFVCPIQNAPNTTVRLILPSGIEALTKELTWSVDITRNEKVQFKTAIRVIEGGEWRIQAYVESLLGSGSRIKQSYYVYVVATDATGHISKTAMQKKRTELKQIPEKEKRN